MQFRNHVEVAGVVDRVLPLRVNRKGVAVLPFRLRVEEVLEGRVVTNWFPVVAWGELAERLGKELAQGKFVCVKGRMHNRRRGDGRVVTEVVAHEVTMDEDKPFWRRLL